MPSITDLLDRVSDSTTSSPIIGALAAPGKAIAASSINLVAATNWTTTTAIHISIYVKTSAGVKDPTTQTDWKGTLAGTTVSTLTLTGGTDRTYNAGDIVELTPTSRYAKDLYDWAIAHANVDGSLKAAAVQTALGLGAGSLNGWNALGYTPNTVTANGNRSYTLVFNGTDITGTISPGMRLRTTRTVAAPTQCTSLNGTTQYYSKTTPNGMTFTNNFVVSAWIKLSSYAVASIASRFDGTSGWDFDVDASGRVRLIGYNAGAANYSYVQSYQSVPLNKWVHVTAQLDMLTFTATPTTSYTMIDGVDVPATVLRNATNPTALIQAGNLQIGAANTTQFFPGKIGQLAIYNAKVTQATILASISQPLAGTETAEISAYSFNNTINDLNANANNLTANGSAIATNADSPFGGQADGTINSTLNYAIVQTATFSTNTTLVVQVPEGCTLATTGGTTSVVYSSNKAPYGFPSSARKWPVEVTILTQIATSGTTTSTYYNPGGININVPIGDWLLTNDTTVQVTCNASTVLMYHGLSTVNNAFNAGSRLASVWVIQQSNNSNTQLTEAIHSDYVSLSVATPYYSVMASTNAFTLMALSGAVSTTAPSFGLISAIPANL